MLRMKRQATDWDKVLIRPILGQPRWRSGLAKHAAWGVILETLDGVCLLYTSDAADDVSWV